ncbi:MAG: UDP-N-acetylglucosamine 1-carboxyvinyltransferase [Clostridiales bacterium]|nr:UDP-N-acetylglucosamine 1-carboxyvinyltransferase [Candidatus Apopatousia equi]
MEKFLIYGGKELKGKLKIKAAKNAVLPILAGSILCKGKVVLHNVPNLTDITNMCKILRVLGCKVIRKNGTISVDSSGINRFDLPIELTNKLRASIFLLGPLVALFKKAKMSFPGGCKIGGRPIDIHLLGLEAFGVEVNEKHGFIYCDGKKMKASEFYLRFPSVGATENLMMASVFNKGTTILYNCAKEPEIVDLQNFLNQMGAKIEGAGSCQIKITGVKKLSGIDYTPIADRIVVGTYILATLITGGNVELSNTNPEHIMSLINKFDGNDCKISCHNDKILVQSSGRLKSVPLIETNPYPDFPTDMQSQMLSLQAVSDGTSVLIENMFESRFRNVPELIKMGADIIVKGNTAIVSGKNALYGADVEATDLRAGASLVLAGLCAKGYTTISEIEHIDRGYDHIERDLQKLGAAIKRIKT